MRKSDGFTLIELLIGILCAALVTGAAVTFLLMGIHSNRALLDANSEQQTVQVLTAMVESLAGEGTITAIYTGDNTGNHLGNHYPGYQWEWAILPDETPVLLYASDKKTIFTSDKNAAITALITGVRSSTLDISPAPMGGCLLTFDIETETAQYEITTYCRTVDIDVKTN